MNFHDSFLELTGNCPFPWQKALYHRFIDGPDSIPERCDIPTGLGKTAVIAIWLLARDDNPALPRRLVYVVNRRTVVDQTTSEVERYKRHRPELAVSTLRGQFADNREWSADPSRPAVICGTVDMIGSRLLFNGYGVGFRGKPLHAGFLGQDALIVHDEAHLEPAFQELLIAIEREQRSGRFPDRHPIRVMELSATSRGKHSADGIFKLTNEELTPPSNIPKPPVEPIHHVWQRLRSEKAIEFVPSKRDAVVETMVRHALLRVGSAVLMFARTIDQVLQIAAELRKHKIPEEHVAILTGTMRGKERDELVKSDRVFARFMKLKDVQPMDGTVFLICTSAGEVGVDMSGDHLISDVTPLDSMMQRLGRVNRRGKVTSFVDVIYESDPDPKPKSPQYEAARTATLNILKTRLPVIEETGRRDASPLGLMALNLTDEDRRAAFAPPPTILETSDILFDAWSMTSIREKMPGRPPVEPYLHGIRDYEPPETQVAWREEVGVIVGDLLYEYPPRDLLDEYPLKPHELLGDRTERVWKELVKLAERHPQLPAWIVDEQGEVDVLRLQDFTSWDKKQAESRLGNRAVLLPHDIGGLTRQGMLDGSFPPDPKNGMPAEVINDDVADVVTDSNERPLRRRIWKGDPDFDRKAEDMRLILRIDFPAPEKDEDADQRSWHWFERPIPKENSKNAGQPVLLSVHVSDVVTRAENIAKDLSLDARMVKAIITAAKLHDLGKKRELWQRSIGRPTELADTWFAKSGRRWRTRDIARYRHEFGSLLDLQVDSEFQSLNVDERELVQHLVATHHGQGRPHFTTEQSIDPLAGATACEEVSVEVMRRFARLQRKCGRWGLAYLESLLRAADWAASAAPSAFFCKEAGR